MRLDGSVELQPREQGVVSSGLIYSEEKLIRGPCESHRSLSLSLSVKS